MDFYGFNIVDLVLGGITVISILVGLARGLVREVLSLAAWGLAIWLAWKFAGQASAQFVRKFIDDEHIAYISAFGGIFLIVLFAIGLFNMLIASIFSAAGLSGFDRLLGMLFGLARGAIICSLLVFFAQLYPSIDKEPWWQQSKLVPGFMNIANWGISKLPPNIRAKADASLHSLDVGVLDNSAAPAPAGQLQLESLDKGGAARPQTDTSIQTAQGNALSSMGESNIQLESMSDDATVDQDTSHIQPDSDEPNTGTPDNSPSTVNDIPAAPPLQLESAQ